MAKSSLNGKRANEKSSSNGQAQTAQDANGGLNTSNSSSSNSDGVIRVGSSFQVRPDRFSIGGATLTLIRKFLGRARFPEIRPETLLVMSHVQVRVSVGLCYGVMCYVKMAYANMREDMPL